MNVCFDYESIKDAVVYSFEEYVGDDGFTASQAAAKLFEEEWRRLNYSNYTKALYFICTAIECIKLKEIPDFIYDKLNTYLSFNNIKGKLNKNDYKHMQKDIQECKHLLLTNDYKIKETSFGTQSRIDYILSLKP